MYAIQLDCMSNCHVGHFPIRKIKECKTPIITSIFHPSNPDISILDELGKTIGQVAMPVYCVRELSTATITHPAG